MGNTNFMKLSLINTCIQHLNTAKQLSSSSALKYTKLIYMTNINSMCVPGLTAEYLNLKYR